MGGPTSSTPPENGAGEFSGQKTGQHFLMKTGSRVVQLSNFSNFWAPAGQFTFVHPTFKPLGEGLRFRLAHNRGVVYLKIPRASVITRSRSQVGLLGHFSIFLGTYTWWAVHVCARYTCIFGGWRAVQSGLQSWGRLVRNT